MCVRECGNGECGECVCGESCEWVFVSVYVASVVGECVAHGRHINRGASDESAGMSPLHTLQLSPNGASPHGMSPAPRHFEDDAMPR